MKMIALMVAGLMLAGTAEGQVARCVEETVLGIGSEYVMLGQPTGGESYQEARKMLKRRAMTELYRCSSPSDAAIIHWTSLMKLMEPVSENKDQLRFERAHGFIVSLQFCSGLHSWQSDQLLVIHNEDCHNVDNKRVLWFLRSLEIEY